MTFAVNLAQGGSNNTTMRNRIINGAMVIDQRNAGASVTLTASQYTLDRWRFGVSVTSKLSAQQNAGSVTPPSGFTNYLGATSLSAYTVGAAEQFQLKQTIEGFNVADLAWGTADAATVTLSFWVRSSLTGTFGGSLTNSAGTRSYPFTYTISTANTWEYETITIAGDTTGTWLTTNGSGIALYFGLGVGSTLSGTAGAWAAANYASATGAVSVVGTSGATFYITGVQLEAGTTASPFEYRQYGTELALCQRYLPVFSALASNRLNSGYFYTTTVFYNNFVFQVPTRVAPTGISTTGSFNATYLSASQAITPLWLGEASTTQAAIYGVTGGAVTAGIGMAIAATSGGTGTIQFTGCEL